MRYVSALAALTVIAATTAISSATAGVEHAAAPTRVDLSSSAAISHYLRTLGVDPATVVVQRGARNYAGSRCPGKAWNCTQAKRVVQIASSARALNNSECTPGTVGADSCVIVQASSGGANTASCRLERKDEKAANVTQSCTVNQTNTTGPNDATTYQALQLNANSVSGAQRAEVTQANGSGANTVSVFQTLLADASDGHQTVAQSQTGDLSYKISQTAASGANTATANQTLTQNAKAPAAVIGTQTQNGNLKGELDQSSSGISTMTSTQDETQTTRFKTGGAVSVTQIGPEDCCSSQGTNPADTFRIVQRSTQTAPGTTQTQQQHAHYTSTGNGTAEQTSTQNGETSTNTDSGSSVEATQSCTNGDCATSTGAFQPGDVLVSVGEGKVQHWRFSDGAWTIVETLDTGLGGYTAGLEFANSLLVTNFTANTVTKFDDNGNLVGTFGSGYDSAPESIDLDSSGNVYVGQADGTADVLKFSASGAPLASFDVATEDRGSDHIDLASDNCTLNYTSEGFRVLRYNVCTNTQLDDLASELPGRLYGIRLLPTGGAIVAATDTVLRLDALGNVTQTYDAPGDDVWFSVDLDPNGTSFFAGDLISGHVVKFDLTTGIVLTSFTTGAPSEGAAAGIAVKG